MKKYYFVKDGTKIGPYTIAELQNIDFEHETLVWYNGLENWVKAEEIKELSDMLKDSPPPVPVYDKQSAEKSKKQGESENQKKTVKRFLTEIGYLILCFLVSLIVSFSANKIYYEVNKPELVTEENQRLFTDKYLERICDKNNSTKGFGDIYAKYLGTSKYDDKFTSSDYFYDINAARLSILEDETKAVYSYTFYILLSLLILTRYIKIFVKWLKPD